MSRLFVTLFVALAATLPVAVFAQESRPKPAGLEKIDDLPPPPQVIIDPTLVPKVTTRTEGDKSIEEYRVNGKLYKIRVVPTSGSAYWLIDPKGDGNFVRSDNGLSPNNAVPMWVVLEW